MAAKEIKSISVAPSAEEATINLWQTFGWELKSNQEVKNKDSHLERRGDSVYNVTETEHYIKLTFERDPARQNYAELKSLEERYYAATPPSPPGNAPKRFGCLFLILIVLSLFFGIGGLIGGIGMAGNMGGVLVTIFYYLFFLILAAPGVLIIIFRNKSYPKRLKPWTEEYDAYQKAKDAYIKDRADMLEQAKALV
jgi:hypothetical protein